MKKFPWVWTFTIVCVSVFVLASFNQSIERVVVCLFSYKYQLVSDQVVVTRLMPSLEDPPLVALNLDLSFYNVEDSEIDPIWTMMFGGVKKIYFRKDVDSMGALSNGVILNLTHPYLGCDWVMLRVFPDG